MVGVVVDVCEGVVGCGTSGVHSLYVYRPSHSFVSEPNEETVKREGDARVTESLDEEWEIVCICDKLVRRSFGAQEEDTISGGCSQLRVVRHTCLIDGDV